MPVSSSTRSESCLLIGSMIRASTRSRNTLSPLDRCVESRGSR